MRQAVLVIAHKNFQQIKRLINYFDGQCDIFIHIDKKSELTSGEIAELSTLKGVNNVYKKYHLSWGSFSILKTELFLLKQAKKNGSYSYFHLISGQDYPLKPLNVFLDYFEKTEKKGFLKCLHLPSPEMDGNTFSRLQFYFFMDFFNYKTDRGRNMIHSIVNMQKVLGFKRRIPDQLKHIYCGSAWFSIDNDLADYILNYTKRSPSFYNRMKYAFIPEEIYVSTVLLNSQYESMISKVENCRHILWNKKKDIDSPQNAELKHFREFVAYENRFFARKFEISRSSEVMSLIDKYLINIKSNIVNSNVYTGISFSRYNYDFGLKNNLIDFCKKQNVKSFADFGCGPGWYVSYLRGISVNAVGFDANPCTCEMSGYINNGKECCFVENLTEELVATEKYDMSMLLNVGQHISKEYEDVVISNLAKNTNKYILVSWEKYGDGTNCVTEEYLVSKFLEYKYFKNSYATVVFRDKSFLQTHKDNLILFEKIEGI